LSGVFPAYEYFNHNEAGTKCCKPAEPKDETGTEKRKLTLQLQIARARFLFTRFSFLQSPKFPFQPGSHDEFPESADVSYSRNFPGKCRGSGGGGLEFWFRPGVIFPVIGSARE